MGRVPAAVMRRDAESAEKVTINLGFVDLGQIDLLVQESFYSNRSDFIRAAIRNQLAQHREFLQAAVGRKPVAIGLHRLSRAALEQARDSGEPLRLRVLGLLSIDEDVPADLAAGAIGSITVLGALHASPAVRAVLADRIRS